MSAPGTRLDTSQPASVAQARESIIDAAHANRSHVQAAAGNSAGKRSERVGKRAA